MELPVFIRERDLRSHLSLIHGMYVGDVKDLDGLNEAHAASHAAPDALWYIGHTHADPSNDHPVQNTAELTNGEADAELEEWSW